MNSTPHYARLNLSKLQRCDQEWENMPEMPGGRLCQQCTKRIVDFTKMSAGEIAHAHLESDAPVCGMYRDDQLRTPARPLPKEAGWKAHPVAFSLVSMLLVEPALSAAQAQTPLTEQVQFPAQDRSGEVPGSMTIGARDSVIIRGRVLEQVDKLEEPAPFVAVYVKGTKTGTVTDFDGYFKLDLTAIANTAESVILVMSYIGHERVEQLVSLTEPEEVVFRLSDPDMNFIAYYVQYTKPPFYEQVWRSIQRTFK